MFKKILGLAVLPILAFAEPAEAKRLFWWQMVSPNGQIVQPNIYDNGYDGQDPAYDPYVDESPEDQAAQDMFNQREYELYKREMKKRYGRDAYYDPQFAYPDQPYAPQPRHVPLKKKRLAKQFAPSPKLAAVKPLVLDPKPRLATSAPPVVPAKPVKTASLSGISCSKGAGIVSSFGFSNVTTKSCSGATLVYGAERAGKPFEVEVSAADGEVKAVKKL